MTRIIFEVPEQFAFLTEMQFYISHVNQGGHLDNAQLPTFPNPAWPHGGTPSTHQQAWSATFLAANGFVLFPSAVSKLSWNLVFEPDVARGKYKLRSQERLVVDTLLPQLLAHVRALAAQPGLTACACCPARSRFPALPSSSTGMPAITTTPATAGCAGFVLNCL